MVDWSKMINYRDQMHNRYPNICDLKLIKRPFRLVKSHLRPGMLILDVGKATQRKSRENINIHRLIVEVSG